MTKEGLISSRRASVLVSLVSGVAALMITSPAQAALITVNSTSTTALNGDGLCTLREAASSADLNSDAGGDCAPGGDASSLDTIQLAATTYDITSALHFGNTSDTGGVKFAGAGMSATTIHGKTPYTDQLINTQSGSALTIDDLTLDGANSTSGFGGAVESISNSITLNRVRITNSTGLLAGGAVYFQPDTTDPPPSYPDAALTITDSVIDHNTSTFSTAAQTTGGGILTQGRTVISGTAITDNTVVNANTNADGLGGGIRSEATADLTLANDLIANNTVNVARDAFGGGVNATGALTAVNVTVTQNSLTSSGTRGGRAIRTQADTGLLTNVTISGNTNQMDGIPALTGGFSLRSSIVDEGALGCEAPVSTLGGNIDRGSSCWTSGAAGDLQNTDPMLGALADNGGLTHTMALLSGSPAFDHVPTASCVDQQSPTPQPVTTDQRGVTRPQGAACDSGAFELFVAAPAQQQSTPPPAAQCAGRSATVAGARATISGTAGNDTITGTPGPDVIDGAGGNDTIRGLAGNDTICGDEGKDKLIGGAGKDKLIGGAGRDTLKGGPGKDRLKGGPGKDVQIQ